MCGQEYEDLKYVIVKCVAFSTGACGFYIGGFQGKNTTVLKYQQFLGTCPETRTCHQRYVDEMFSKHIRSHQSYLQNAKIMYLYVTIHCLLYCTMCILGARLKQNLLLFAIRGKRS